MKKIWIVGGIGPASTLDRYSGIINGFRQKTNDDNYAKIIINSISVAEMLSCVSYENWDSLVNLLLNSIENSTGAELAAITSDTPRIVFDEVQKQSALPLISILEETCKSTQLTKCKKVVVIGANFASSSGLYNKEFQKYDSETVVPAEDAQAEIYNIIFPKPEDIEPEDKQRILEIAERLLKKRNEDGLDSGSTEFSLIIKTKDLNTLILNATQILG